MHDKIARLVSGGAKEAGMKGWRERATDIFTKHGKIAAKMKSAPGPGPSDLATIAGVLFSIVSKIGNLFVR